MHWLGVPVLILWSIVASSTAFLAYLKRSIRAEGDAKRTAILKSLGVSSVKAVQKRCIGFFHPYCNAGGGGERVLWTAIAFLQRTEPEVVSVVYTGDKGVTKEDIIDKVKARFDIALDPSSLHFVFLTSRTLVEDATWPRFTLLGQSLGSIYLAWEAMSKFVPDLYIDTMGYAFTFYIVRLLGDIPVGAYVHYPTISTEMLHRVQSRTAWHTNSDVISSSVVLSRGKRLYYRLFMYYYSRSLQNATFLMVNSTWTKNHVDSVINYSSSDTVLSIFHSLLSVFAAGLWVLMRTKTPPRPPTRIAYPPCDTKQMSKFPLTNRERIILSLAQFRPEKDHAAQLYSVAELFKAHSEYRSGSGKVKLILMGSSRNAEDAARIENLKTLATHLNIATNVEFVVNAPYSVLLDHLSRASIGISTMVDEHFGINVVEFMAAGLVPVVHASGGPLNDIVVHRNGQPTGYHCTSPATFADALHAALSLPPKEDIAMRTRAREHAVEQFSEREFENAWEKGGWAKWKETGSLAKQD